MSSCQKTVDFLQVAMVFLCTRWNAVLDSTDYRLRTVEFLQRIDKLDANRRRKWSGRHFAVDEFVVTVICLCHFVRR